jgi:hypothetical protein
MAQINIAAHRDKSERPTGNKANGQSTGPMQASIQRITRPPEARKDPARRGEQPASLRVTRFNVPPPDASANPPLQQSAWLRPLIIGLILIALIPNVTLGAVLWLGLIDPPWVKEETPPPPAPETQPTPPAAVLTAPATLEATAGDTIKFPIALDNTDGVPSRSVIAIQGLPPGSTLSDGRPYGDEWDLKSDQIGDLNLTLPPNAHGEMQIAISLIAADNTVIADTETILRVTPALNELQVQAPVAQPAAGNADKQQASVTAEPNEDGGTAGAEDVSSGEPTAAIPTSAAPEESAPVEADADPTKFVRPSAYVNLRDGPSSSSSVIGVIARGTRLAVVDRKRGWVKVNDPATSKEGWIYSGYVGGGHHARPRKKATAPPTQKADSSSSFWKWLLQ